MTTSRDLTTTSTSSSKRTRRHDGITHFPAWNECSDRISGAHNFPEFIQTPLRVLASVQALRNNKPLRRKLPCPCGDDHSITTSNEAMQCQHPSAKRSTHCGELSQSILSLSLYLCFLCQIINFASMRRMSETQESSLRSMGIVRTYVLFFFKRCQFQQTCRIVVCLALMRLSSSATSGAAFLRPSGW